MLIHALLGYQIKPFRISIPALGCFEFLKIIEPFLNGWMAINQTSALSPCPESAKISLVSEVVRVESSQCVVRYNYTAHEVFDVSVCNCYSSCGSDVYLFHFAPSALFLFVRFGSMLFGKSNPYGFYCVFHATCRHASKLIILRFG